MTVLVIFLVLCIAGVAGWARREPARARELLGQAKVRASAAVAGTGPVDAVGVRQAKDPKSLLDQVVRDVTNDAKPLYGNVKMPRNRVFVYISQARHDDLGAGVLAILGDQLVSAIDGLIAAKGWQTAGPTAVTWQVESTLHGDAFRVDLLAGTGTICFGADTTGETGAADPTTRTVPEVDRLEVGGVVHRLPRTGDTIVGRDRACGVFLRDAGDTVSRRQFTVTTGGRGARLRSTSSNWTKVNGTKVEQVDLADGDIITVPDGTSIVFRAGARVEAGR